MKVRIGVVLVAAALLAVACGGDDGGSDDAAPSSGETQSTGEVSTDADPADGAVVIEHSYGTTELDAIPERIVSFDSQWTDVLAALDAPVVGALFNPYGERLPWQQDVLPGIEELTYGADAIPYEAIAALRPDLIVVSWEIDDRSAYDQLSLIAPTIPLLAAEGVDPWQDMARVAGRVLDREAAAAELVADAEQLSADVLAELPGLDGRAYVLANYVPGDSIWIVADPEDGAGVFFSQIGMHIAPHILDLPNLQMGRVQLSLEQVALLDSDLLVILTNGADTDEIAGYAALDVVQAGAVSILDIDDVSALNTPTPLSIPYALDLIRPVLEVVAG